MRHLIYALLLAGCNLGRQDIEDAQPAPGKPHIPNIPPDPDGDKYLRPPGGPNAVLLQTRPKNVPMQPGETYEGYAPGVERTSWGYEVTLESGSPITTPAVFDGKVIVSGGFNSKAIFAFAAKTGEQIWARELSDDGPSAPVCEGTICAFNTESCTTFAVNAKTGETLWAWWLGDPETSAPTLANGHLFTSYPSRSGPGASHVLVAFNAKTGKMEWQRWLDADVMSSPVANGDFVYVTTFGGTVLKLEQSTGNTRYAVEMRGTSAPVITFNGKTESLYVSERIDEHVVEKPREALVRADVGASHITFRANPKMAPYLDADVQARSAQAAAAHTIDSGNGFYETPTAANASSAKLTVGVQNVSTMQGFQGSRILFTGALAIATMGDEVVAVQVDDGQIAWKHSITGAKKNAGGFAGTAPILAGHDVVFGTLAGQIVRLDVATGNVKATYNVHAPIRSQPVAMNGWIYAGTEDGKLVAIDTGDGSITGWPFWGGDAQRSSVKPL